MDKQGEERMTKQDEGTNFFFFFFCDRRVKVTMMRRIHGYPLLLSSHSLQQAIKKQHTKRQEAVQHAVHNSVYEQHEIDGNLPALLTSRWRGTV